MLTEEEYREMYTEYAMESGSRMTEEGFEEFKSWRKKVEKYLYKCAEST